MYDEWNLCMQWWWCYRFSRRLVLKAAHTYAIVLMFFYPDKNILSLKWEFFFDFLSPHTMKITILNIVGFSCNWISIMCVTVTVRGKNLFFHFIVVCVYWYKNQRMNATVLRYWLFILYTRRKFLMCKQKLQLVIIMGLV